MTQRLFLDHAGIRVGFLSSPHKFLNRTYPVIVLV
jgi:hypothetical protein